MYRPLIVCAIGALLSAPVAAQVNTTDADRDAPPRRAQRPTRADAPRRQMNQQDANTDRPRAQAPAGPGDRARLPRADGTPRLGLRQGARLRDGSCGCECGEDRALGGGRGPAAGNRTGQAGRMQGPRPGRGRAVAPGGRNGQRAFGQRGQRMAPRGQGRATMNRPGARFSQQRALPQRGLRAAPRGQGPGAVDRPGRGMMRPQGLRQRGMGPATPGPRGRGSVDRPGRADQPARGGRGPGQGRGRRAGARGAASGRPCA